MMKKKGLALLLVVGLLLAVTPQFVMAADAIEKDAAGTTVTAPTEAAEKADADAKVNVDTKADAKDANAKAPITAANAILVFFMADRAFAVTSQSRKALHQLR